MRRSLLPTPAPVAPAAAFAWDSLPKAPLAAPAQWPATLASEPDPLSVLARLPASVSAPPIAPQACEPRALHVAVVCAANMNRSMAAHDAIRVCPVRLSSFGTASKVKLPGRRGPLIFHFGESYASILDELNNTDNYERAWCASAAPPPRRLSSKGILRMLERNASLKFGPERWHSNARPHDLDLVVCFDERVFENVLDGASATRADAADVRARPPSGHFRPLHVLGLDTEDNNDSALKGAETAKVLIYELLTRTGVFAPTAGTALEPPPGPPAPASKPLPSFGTPAAVGEAIVDFCARARTTDGREPLYSLVYV